MSFDVSFNNGFSIVVFVQIDYLTGALRPAYMIVVFCNWLVTKIQTYLTPLYIIMRYGYKYLELFCPPVVPGTASLYHQLGDVVESEQIDPEVLAIRVVCNPACVSICGRRKR